MHTSYPTMETGAYFSNLSAKDTFLCFVKNLRFRLFPQCIFTLFHLFCYDYLSQKYISLPSLVYWSFPSGLSSVCFLILVDIIKMTFHASTQSVHLFARGRVLRVNIKHAQELLQSSSCFVRLPLICIPAAAPTHFLCPRYWLQLPNA